MTSVTMKNLPGYSAIPEQTERMIQPSVGTLSPSALSASVSPHQLSVKLDMYVRVGKAHSPNFGTAAQATQANQTQSGQGQVFLAEVANT